MKKTNLLLFLISVSFFGCTGGQKNQIASISDIAVDFPTSEKLEFKPFNEYEIFDGVEYMIDDSILWQFSRTDKANVGYCYDLNTGEKLSAIASIGKANNEFYGISFSNTRMTNDSIQLYATGGLGGFSVITSTGDECTIKTFAKKDIIENKLIGERKFSVITRPENVYASKMVKLPNGSGLVTIISTIGEDTSQKESDINNNSVVIFNDNGVKGYQTIDYDSFDIKLSHSDFEPSYLIKTAYNEGCIEIRDNDLAAFSVYRQFILYTLDINSGKVINEKRYTNMKAKGNTSLGMNDMSIQIDRMKSNDKHIFCIVSGYFSKEDKELEQKKKALFVFDWDLKPIKRFELPDVYNYKFIISQDCSSIYISELTEGGLVLTKADLNI